MLVNPWAGVRVRLFLSVTRSRWKPPRVSEMIGAARFSQRVRQKAGLARGLEQLGAPASYAIGALVPQLSRHAAFRAGSSCFVVETDESDGTLREFHPEHSIVLNIDEEHLDFYSNLEAICAAFREFGRQTKGMII